MLYCFALPGSITAPVAVAAIIIFIIIIILVQIINTSTCPNFNNSSLIGKEGRNAFLWMMKLLTAFKTRWPNEMSVTGSFSPPLSHTHTFAY